GFASRPAVSGIKRLRLLLATVCSTENSHSQERTMFWSDYGKMNDDELLKAADDWAANERRQTIDILGILIAADDRDLPSRRGYPTTFKFGTERLKFSEAAAYWRIRAARAAKAFPEIAHLLESGDLNVTTVTLLSAYLTTENADDLIARAAGKSRKDV